MRSRHALLAGLLALAACGPGGREVSAAGKRRAASPSPPPPVICPLTGTQLPPGSRIDHPALAIKVENSVAARPQAGLEHADIVYEELAEGGITRFLVVYHCSEARSVGPVRSARSVDPDILLEYAPVLFAYSGANPGVLSKVRSTKGVVDLRHGTNGDAYRRARGRRAPHNLFTSTGTLRALSDVRGAPETGLVFDARVLASPSPPPAGKAPKPKATAPASPASSPTPPPGSAVSFSFAGTTATRYVFDPSLGAYLRFHGPTAHRSEAGPQLRAVNVVVLEVAVREGDIRDAAGNYSPEITVVGSGEAVVLRGGVAVGGRWVRRTLSDRTRLQDAGGRTIALLPGNTWIHLLPAGQPLLVE